MRMLVINDEVKAKAARIIEHANLFPYYPGKSIPGDHPNHVGMFNSYRVVYSLTVVGGVAHRHLSISLPDARPPHVFPNPMAVFTIADLFGFTGWDHKSETPPETWAMEIDREHPTVILLQIIGAAEPAIQ